MIAVVALQVIAQHLFREGRFELGEEFIKEAGVAVPSTLKVHSISLTSIFRLCT